MPGAPNRPPESTPPPPPPTAVAPDRKALRRLVPSHVALLLDTWKGPLAPDLAGPLEKAEAAFDAADFSGASAALDVLSVRFAEPRWPTLPEPFRQLRVLIFAPMPPSWNPEHALPAPEREVLRVRKDAEAQLALALGCVAWASQHGLRTDDLEKLVEEARSALGTTGVAPAFFDCIDTLWTTLRPRLPRPRVTGTRAPVVAAAEKEPEEA